MQIHVSDHVRYVAQLHDELLDREPKTLSINERLEHQAQRILTGHRAQHPAVPVHLRSWFPGTEARPIWKLSDEELFGLDLTLDDARLTIAREYGFRDWHHVEEQGTKGPDPTFEQAVDAVVTGDLHTLETLIGSRTRLTEQRSDYGHRSTLLHYVGANGVETHRQTTPLNLAEVAKLLLDNGAEVNAEAEMYGGGSTALGLLLTSAHPREAGVVDEVAAVLRAAGAQDHPPAPD